jgi:hypothetical protein
MKELISKAIELNNMELLKQLLESQAEAEKMASKKVFYSLCPNSKASCQQ